MKLEEMSTKTLLALHNAIADAPAGPKTFATKGKLIARIESIAAAGNINLASFGWPETVEAVEQRAEQQADAAEATDATEKKRGIGVGELARRLLMDPAGYPHSLIAEMVNVEIPGATATAKSVRWYACKMRKEGAQVPERHKAFPAEMDAEQSAEWLATVRVVTSGS
ncbi:MAG: hypothetical protein Q7U80_04540 [Thiobacillus sp.]|nr:hypothetical protein [Thiobacillus sp.]MDP3125598.1 hypothetical protein [Thiobacillus sp.]